MHIQILSPWNIENGDKDRKYAMASQTLSLYNTEYTIQLPVYTGHVCFTSWQWDIVWWYLLSLDNQTRHLNTYLTLIQNEYTIVSSLWKWESVLSQLERRMLTQMFYNGFAWLTIQYHWQPFVNVDSMFCAHWEGERFDFVTHTYKYF